MKSQPDTRLHALCLATTLLALGGCGSVGDFLGGDRIDYRSQTTKTPTLEVPPDLTQLAKETRYQPQSGSVSAATLQQTAASGAPQAAPAVTAPNVSGAMRIERQGSQRWLVTPMTPEQLWPQLRAFWQGLGFVLATDTAEAGVMETDWAENRGKLPQDGVRRTLGPLLEPLFATGERDRFRTRVERVAGGTEVYISHRGMEETPQGDRKDTFVWVKRPSDPQLEAEMLTRLMVKLGTKEETARATVAAAPAPVAAPRARALTAGTMEVDEGFDRAWRRVGLALDRSGFTVEDRDRSGGLYFVRYADPKQAGKEEPGFFARLFGGGGKDAQASLQRYRVALKAAGDKTQVTVQNTQGATEQTEVGQRIVGLLVDELK